MYVPTNHLYIGDVFLVSTKDVIRPNLSVREGIGEKRIKCFFFFTFDNVGRFDVLNLCGVFYECAEIVVSGGMSMPQVLSTLDMRMAPERSRSSRVERN